MAVMSSIMLTIRSSYKRTHLVYPTPHSDKETDDSNHDDGLREREQYTVEYDEDYDSR